jgi:nicotinamide mononucleotide (NMN) deamidase PncC
MTASQHQELIERIHGSGKQLVFSITGGGSGAISNLLQVSGASASVLEAVVPYASTALREWLGGPVENYCSAKTARAMAMAAFERARQLSSVDPHKIRGIGATASLATTRPKRGEHRIHVAWQSATVTSIASLTLTKGERTRAQEEEIATNLILDAVAQACEIVAPRPLELSLGLPIEGHQQRAPKTWSELLLGGRSIVEIPEERKLVDPHAAAHQTQSAILFPGAFNPPHWGHDRMAEIAARRYGGPVRFELSMTNVDKPPLDFIDIGERLEQLAGRRVLLTRAPTFVEKARLAPGSVFIVGADTLERIADPSYYGGDVARRDAAIAEIAELKCRFLVFGRWMDGKFSTPAAPPLPAALLALCEDVPESEFRADVSSTELRQSEAK